MDAWNKFVAQATDVFTSMSGGARAIAALLIVAIVLGAAFLFRGQSDTADDYLLAGRAFSPSELVAAQRAFSEAGLKHFDVVGTQIKVPRGQRAAYIAALAEHNAVPADYFSYMSKALASDNPFVSQKVMEEKLKNAKQQELALCIKGFRGVEEANVMYSETDKSGFKREKHKTATVNVKSSTGLEDRQVRAILDLVSRAYAGLERRNISVIDVAQGRSYASPDEADGGFADNLYASHKAKYESDWKRKIEDRLSNIPGVIVGVNVELDPEIHQHKSTIKLDDKPKAIRSTEETSESQSTAPDVGGPAGARANGVGDGFRGNQPQALSGSSSGPSSTNSRNKSDTQNAMGHEHLMSSRAALIPSNVQVSIDIPRSYFMKIWKKSQAATPAPAAGAAATAAAPPAVPNLDELKRIEKDETLRVQNAVNKLLPPEVEGKDPFPRVVVTAYEDLPVDMPAPVAFAATATTFAADNWQTIAMVVMGFVAIFMLRGMVAASAPAPAPAAQALPSSSDSREDADAEEDETEKREEVLKARRKMSASGPNLRDELRDLVREDPDAAANVLKVWIGDAA